MNAMTFQSPSPKILRKLFEAKRAFGPVVKNKKNPFYGSMYTDYDGLLAAISEALEAHALLLLQPTIVQEGQTFIRTTIIDVESGDAIWSDYPIATTVEASAKVPKGFDGIIPVTTRTANSQELGSATTYARRYSLSALLALPADEDDDGNAALGGGNTQQTGGASATSTRKKAETTEEDIF